MILIFSFGVAQSEKVRRFSKEWKKRGPENHGIQLNMNISINGEMISEKKELFRTIKFFGAKKRLSMATKSQRKFGTMAPFRAQVIA